MCLLKKYSNSHHFLNLFLAASFRTLQRFLRVPLSNSNGSRTSVVSNLGSCNKVAAI